MNAEVLACEACGAANPANARFCLDCGARLAVSVAGTGDARRIVTIVFADIVGSTALGEALDPEALRSVMARYFSAMERAVRSHGGTVEKFIGDAVMAVFGLRRTREDDALRGVRAAADMVRGLAELNHSLASQSGVTLASRIGVNTGEVMVGESPGQHTLVTGDVVNTAARLEQAAGAGEILVSETTWQLVRAAVRGEEVGPVAAKGKQQPVAAFRLLAMDESRGNTQRPVPSDRPVESASDQDGTHFVGRDSELRRLRELVTDVAVNRRPGLVTVVGPAGVGKSRLVRQFEASIAPAARVLRGRCLSYGEGITYWPVREILHEAASIDESDSSAVAISKLEALVVGLPDGPILAARLAAAIGLDQAAAPQEEIFWAFRQTVAQLAAQGPLVVIVEDVHWAAPVLLELLSETIAGIEREPVAIVALARPEIDERAPGWLSSTQVVELGGLSRAAANQIIDAISGGTLLQVAVRDRILERADGNPLFVEELARMVVDHAARGTTGANPIHFELPLTIQGLLRSRLDDLPIEPRAVARRASVVGRTFERRSVAGISPEDQHSAIGPSLSDLVRRQFVTVEGAIDSDPDAYKFRHVLIRDAAYESLPKSERADLHERFAIWLIETAGERLVELEAIVAHHFAAAHRYRIELRESGEAVMELARRAASYFGSAARGAIDRGDLPAALELAGAGLAVSPDDAVDTASLSLVRARALLDTGLGRDAIEASGAALEIAQQAGDRRLASEARVLRAEARSTIDALGPDEMDRELALALEDADAAGDARVRAIALQRLADHDWNQRRFEAMDQHHAEGIAAARAAGERGVELEIERDRLTSALTRGRADSVVEQGRQLLARTVDFPTLHASIESLVAVPEAMLEEFEEAKRHSRHALTRLHEMRSAEATFCYFDLALIARLEADFDEAASELRIAIAEAEDAGNSKLTSVLHCRLIQMLVWGGRVSEAAGRLPDDPSRLMPLSLPVYFGARARIRASSSDPAIRSGALVDVERLLSTVSSSVDLGQRADVHVDAAETMALLGRHAEALRHAHEARRLAAERHNIALGRQIQALVERLESSSAAPASPF